jgi:hypothetical protein
MAVLPCLNPNAAGVDVGATEIYIAVPTDRGKVLSVQTRKVKNRAATALRMAAQSLHHSQSYLGHFYRRMRAKLGAPKAITATAHKLARIIYHMVTTGQEYYETMCAQNEIQHRQV